MEGGLASPQTDEELLEVADGYHDAGLRSVLDDMLEGRYGDDRQTAIRAMVDEGVNLDKAAEITVCVREFT